MKNKTILQNFEWYLPNDGRHWDLTAERAAYLESLGITDVWMPPAYKGFLGIHDSGYGVYDHYDLGEFFQKGAVRTKYGTKEAYLAAIRALHDHHIRVIGDIALNYRMGSDDLEDAVVDLMDTHNRLHATLQNRNARVSTVFYFPGRAGKYSGFIWNRTHFNGLDYDHRANTPGLFKLKNSTVNANVDEENGNYDCLMGCNHNLSNPEVREELIRWGEWYMDVTGLDGVRLDAVKHMGHTFFPQWLERIRAHRQENVFAVGDYWFGDVDKLRTYLEKSMHCMSLFDVPLHYRFHEIAAEYNGGGASMRELLQNTLADLEPDYAVTFVDNHDTQPGQALQSWVREWFKPLAYAFILLRQQGTPCVFYGDLFGIPSSGIPAVKGLDTILKARRRFAYGEQMDYFDHPNTLGWTRRGGGAGDMAVLMTNSSESWKDMALGRPGEVYVDLLGNCPGEIRIDADGNGRFPVSERSVSIWVRKDQAFA